MATTWSTVSDVDIDQSLSDEWNNRAHDTVRKTLQEYHDFHRQNDYINRWKHVRKHGTFRVYTDRNHKRSDERVLLTSGLAPGRVEDVLSGLHASTSEAVRVVYALTSPTWLDASVLKVFEDNPLTSPVVFAGVIRYVNDNPILFSTREAIYYDMLGWVQDAYDATFVYRVSLSVDIPGYAHSDKSGLERVQVNRISLYRQMQNGWIGCFTRIDVDAGGNIPGAIADYLIGPRANGYYGAMACARAKAYSKIIAQHEDVFVPESSTCMICQCKAQFLTKLKQCEGCHQYVCKKCRHKRTTYELAKDSRKPAKYSFCTRCVENVDTSNPRFSRSSNTSSSEGSHQSSSVVESWHYAGEPIESIMEEDGTCTNYEPSVASSLSMGTVRDLSQEDRPSIQSSSSPELDEKPTRMLVQEWENIKSSLEEWNEAELGEFEKMSNRPPGFWTKASRRMRISASELD